MMMSETLDNYGERAGECEYLTLAFSPISAPLRTRWRNNGLSADFLGDYVTTFLPANGAVPALESRQNEIKHAVTYIANELLENAMKYHQPDVEIPIRIHLELASDHITVSVSNGVSAVQAEPLQSVRGTSPGGRRERSSLAATGRERQIQRARPCPAWAC